MKSNHTPGPWAASIASKDQPIHIYQRSSGDVLAHILPYNTVFSEANAHLIAAAPEMLEALEEFLLCGPNVGHNQDFIALVKAAIAKAKGGAE